MIILSPSIEAGAGSTLSEGVVDTGHVVFIGGAHPEIVRFGTVYDPGTCADESMRVKAHFSANWTCAYCGSNNNADRETCRGCQAPRHERGRMLPDAAPERPKPTNARVTE